MEDNAHLAVLILGVLFVALGLFKVLRLLRLLNSGVRTTGRVVSTRFNPLHSMDDEASAYLTVRFETSEGPREFQEVVRPPIIGRLTDAKVARYREKTVKVIYDSENPLRASVSVGSAMIRALVFLLVGIVLLGAFAIYGRQVDDVKFTPPYQTIFNWLQ